MIAFILRRVVQSVGVMLAVALVAFIMFKSVGDPVMLMLAQDASEQDRVALREELGLNDTPAVQFYHFVYDAVRGDFGYSLQHGQKVSTLLRERVPATLELSFVASLIALCVGLPLGVYTALRRNSFLSQALRVLSLLGVSLPTFLKGILLILVFSVFLRWLPSFGRGEVVRIGFWSTGLLTRSGWSHLILPAITLSFFQMTLVLRLVRAEMLEVLRSDYIKFARARGLTKRAIHYRHALKNTLIPVITVL